MNMQRIGRAVAPLVLLIAVAVFAQWQQHEQPQGKDPAATRMGSRALGFDYYLVALSWSPTWCESHPQDTEQCGRRGFGFILHGLWPQYERGGGPQDCTFGERPHRATIERTLSFMPSRNLIEHQWRTHGTCSGLDPDAYFELADRAYAGIRIPAALSASSTSTALRAEEIRRSFVDANPGIAADGVAVICHSGKLAEVRICVDDELQPRRCGRGVRMQCPKENPVRIPRIR
jgi:ribonuclease T2